MIQAGKILFKFGKVAKKGVKKIGKTKFGKGAKKVDKAVGKSLFKVGGATSRGFKSFQSKVKSTGTYKDIRGVARKFPLTFGQTAGAFTLGAGIGTLASQGYDKATGYKRVRVKKQKG
tara:strand:- start:473 stop:826 length:354 start_codon:yes stop_codon:yes gene_type:complete